MLIIWQNVAKSVYLKAMGLPECILYKQLLFTNLRRVFVIPHLSVEAYTFMHAVHVLCTFYALAS